jgi:predicted metalloprotease
MKSRLAAALLPLLLLVAACGTGGDDDAGGGSRSPIERDEDDETTTTVDQTAGIDLEDVPEDDQDDVIIEATLAEVERFWEDQFALVSNGDFEPVETFVPYGPDRELPECGGPLEYEEIAQNAFYCPFDDVIAWDTDNLTNDLLADFGAFSLAIVTAHEYGHAIQARVPVDGPTVALEQQADCFAGAFTAFVEDGGSDVLAVSIDDLDSAVAGFLTLRDAPGTPASDPSAHGSAFDRIGAFQDGFLNGSGRCAEYEAIYAEGGSTVIDLQFTSQEEAISGGNAPFDEIFDITLGSLETFWTEAMPDQFDIEWDPLAPDGQVVAFDPDDPDSLPDCPGLDATVDDLAGQAFTCIGDPDDPDDDFVAFDINLAAEQYDEIGDFAVSGIISQQYSFVAQTLLGNLESDRDSLLQADCFSGAWAGELTLATLQEGGQELLDETIGPVAISAGDLDEAVQSFLLLGDQASANENQGTPFERVVAFRDGFLNGLPQCAGYLEDGAPDEEEGVPTEDG